MIIKRLFFFMRIVAISAAMSYSEAQSGVCNIVQDSLFMKDAYYFYFKYSRNYELAADIVAYRYCESMRMGGCAYMNCLGMIMARWLLGIQFIIRT